MRHPSRTEGETSVTRVANYVVAYEATERGNDTVELGVALARLTRSELRLCLVLPHHSSTVPARVGAVSSPDYQALLEAQALEWLEQGRALVPDDVVATTHLLYADSTTEGLLQAARTFDSDRIVVGASRRGLMNRFTIGSVASALLHASPVPVALAPRGYQAPAQLTRITCAIGTRPGWKALLDSLVAFSEDLTVDLRFVTLVEVDAGRRHPVEVTESQAHLAGVLEYFQSRSKASGTITTEVGSGHSVETAVEALDWQQSEIAFVGSSRLAQPTTIFLGITAHRMLHALPVPLIVVPTGTDARKPH
ncbi:universal stress protein [Cryobacterium sinapicolor]|uniref:Universal stress protein n=1 Tax=Cryobacterium sinapicolor TaxID=1259236 RepID=A0ABY2JB03_9MICO|nr:universal stress protein [Cryobacterium sinapicolor]